MNDFLRRLANMNRDMPKSTKNIFVVLFVVLAGYMLYKLYQMPSILIMIAAFYFAIVLHEIAHGAMAYFYGDPTAKIAGRLSLNPIKHVDIIGMVIPMIFMLFGLSAIGWAKPVPVNYRLLKRGNLSIFMVSIAGVAVNFILAFLAGIAMVLLGRLNIPVYISSIIKIFLIYSININVVLGVFNLIPIPPLDGSRILYIFSDSKVRRFLDSMEIYGIFIILILMSLGVIERIISPISGFVIGIMLNYIGAIL